MATIDEKLMGEINRRMKKRIYGARSRDENLLDLPLKRYVERVPNLTDPLFFKLWLLSY